MSSSDRKRRAETAHEITTVSNTEVEVNFCVSLIQNTPYCSNKTAVSSAYFTLSNLPFELPYVIKVDWKGTGSTGKEIVFSLHTIEKRVPKWHSVFDINIRLRYDGRNAREESEVIVDESNGSSSSLPAIDWSLLVWPHLKNVEMESRHLPELPPHIAWTYHQIQVQMKLKYINQMSSSLYSTLFSPLPNARSVDNSAFATVNVKERSYLVPKEILAKSSTYFDRAFFGPFREADDGALTMNSFEPEVFEKLLKIILDGFTKDISINDITSLLDIADYTDCELAMFSIESALISLNTSLITNKYGGRMETIVFAEQYGLFRFMQHYIDDLFSNNDNIIDILSSRELLDLRFETKRLLQTRAQLKRSTGCVSPPRGNVVLLTLPWM